MGESVDGVAESFSNGIRPSARMGGFFSEKDFCGGARFPRPTSQWIFRVWSLARYERLDKREGADLWISSSIRSVHRSRWTSLFLEEFQGLRAYLHLSTRSKGVFDGRYGGRKLPQNRTMSSPLNKSRPWNR